MCGQMFCKEDCTTHGLGPITTNIWHKLWPSIVDNNNDILLFHSGLIHRRHKCLLILISQAIPNEEKNGEYDWLSKTRMLYSN